MSATTTTKSALTTTTTTTLIGSPPAMTSVATYVSEKQCPACGGNGSASYASADGAQHRIRELEGQVQILTERASVTAAKLTDYEAEVQRLRASQATYDTPRDISSLPPSSSQTDPPSLSTQPPVSPSAVSANPPQQQTNSNYSRLATLTSLLPYRRGSATTPTTPANASSPASPANLPTSPNPRAQEHQQQSPTSNENTSELQDALSREQNLRKAAESQLSQASTELEELTVQLFSQANEMVAQERKARAKLEERVAVLERRDVEKRSRLERLEKAMARVERLRALVNH